MVAKIVLKWNIAAFSELRTSPGVTADIRKRGERIATACGDGYVSETQVHSSRARAGIYTWSAEAMRDNAKHNTLLRSLDAARG